MRKLPLVWIAIVAALTALAESGCAISGRQWIRPANAFDAILVAPAKSATKSFDCTVPLNGETRQTSPSTPTSTNDASQNAQQTIPAQASDRKPQITPTAWIPGEGAEEGDYGVYVSGGSTIHNFPAAIGSTGFVHLPTPWTTLRYGVMGVDDGGIGAGGVEAGVRLHAPTRITPYVGLSTDLGFSGFHNSRRYQGPGVKNQVRSVTQLGGLAAIVPEAGVSYWVTPSMRLNAGASYFVAAGQSDFLLFGLSMEFLVSDGSGSTSSNAPTRVSTNRFDDEPADSYFVDLNGMPDPMEIFRRRVAQRALKEADDSPFEELTDPGSNSGDSSPILDNLPPRLVPQSGLFNSLQLQ